MAAPDEDRASSTRDAALGLVAHVSLLLHRFAHSPNIDLRVATRVGDAADASLVIDDEQCTHASASPMTWNR
jgi:hypothetical protein